MRTLSVLRGLADFAAVVNHLRLALIDHDIGLSFPTRPGGPLPQGEDEPGQARDHQDHSNGAEVDALNVKVGCKAQNRANCNQEDAPGECHAGKLPGI